VVSGIRRIYNTYLTTTEEPVEYDLFKDILLRFNSEILEHLLQGGVLQMKNKLSTLSIWRRKRDPSITMVDWGTSNKIKKEILAEGNELYNEETGKGEKWIVYFTDERYFRFRWFKDKCMVKNKSVYRFDPARGVLGKSPKERLTALVKNDDLAYLRFRSYDGNI